MFTALVRVTGAGRLADFRERLRGLLVRDPDAEDYSEHHEEGRLEYRFAPKKGIPFPAASLRPPASFRSCASKPNGTMTACAAAR